MTNNNDDIMIHGFESEDILNRLHVDVPLFGGEGNDTLDSGEGHDVLFGELNNDLFAASEAIAV
jgi:Ca2+-binding RTX toxin-like protein